MRRAREECCDDLAVSLCGDAKLYARALTNLEGLRQRQPALTLAATDKPLLARVLRLLGLKEVRHTLPLATGALLLLMVAATAALSFTALPVAAQNANEADAQPSSLWVSVSLGVAFDDAYTRITKMVVPDRAYLLVEERSVTEQRTVRVTRGTSNTDLVYSFTVDGEVRPFNRQARAWFNAALEEGALEPLRQHASEQAQGPESRGAWLSVHTSHDEADRHVSFVRTNDVFLNSQNTTASQIDAGWFDRLTHYAAHDLVPDSEMGSYVKWLIQNASAAQLETLTPSITGTLAEIEDEATKAEVVKVLEARSRNPAEQREPKADSSLSAPVSQPGVGTLERTAAPTRDEGVATGRVEWHNTLLPGVKVELRTHRGRLDDENCCKPQRTLRTTTTDENGEFRFEGVPTGSYTLRRGSTCRHLLDDRA